MDFRNRIPRALHEEHRATLELLEALEDLSVKHRRAAPDPQDRAVQRTLRQAIAVVDDDVRHHFAFEEAELFTRMAAMGDVAIGRHLTDEHQILLPLCEQLQGAARTALDAGFSAASWSDFKGLAAELTERMQAHIQKEEMALLPMLEDILDRDTDVALAEQYAKKG
jgi:hemerythrin-like domain-containing protein